jgi:hypothetical protein
MHPRLLSMVLTPAEVGEWFAYLRLKQDEIERAQRQARRRRTR